MSLPSVPADKQREVFLQFRENEQDKLNATVINPFVPHFSNADYKGRVKKVDDSLNEPEEFVCKLVVGEKRDAITPILQKRQEFATSNIAIRLTDVQPEASHGQTKAKESLDHKVPREAEKDLKKAIVPVAALQVHREANKNIETNIFVCQSEMVESLVQTVQQQQNVNADLRTEIGLLRDEVQQLQVEKRGLRVKVAAGVAAAALVLGFGAAAAAQRT